MRQISRPWVLKVNNTKRAGADRMPLFSLTLTGTTEMAAHLPRWGVPSFCFINVESGLPAVHSVSRRGPILYPSASPP